MSNERNKNQFAKILCSFLEADGPLLIQSHGDADTDIISEALRFATQGNSVTVVADATDIYLLSGSTESRRKLKKLISICELAEKTSRGVLQNLLLIHAWSGCDSTSAIYGHGKCAIIKIIQKFESVLSCCKTLADDAASYSHIASAGSQIFVKMYGRKPSYNLDYLRYIKYMEYAATSTKTLQPE